MQAVPDAENVIMREYALYFSDMVKAAILSLSTSKKDGPKPSDIQNAEEAVDAAETLSGTKANLVREAVLQVQEKLQKDVIFNVVKAAIDPSNDAYDAQFIIPSLSDVNVNSDEVNQDRLEAIRAKGKNQLRSLLEQRQLRTFAQVSETNTETIMRRVEDGIKNKKTIQDIAAGLTYLLEDVRNPMARAATIARTEVFTASSIGQAAAMKVQSKVIKGLKKAWITAGDVSVRGHPNGKPSQYNHYVLQGEVKNWNEPFSNGLMHPHDPNGEPGNVINCRCTMITLSPKDAELIGLDNLSSDLPRDNPRPKE